MPLRPALQALLLIFKVFCVVAIGLALLWTAYIIGPHIEAKYFPVVSKLTITDMREDGGRAMIYAQFTKHRNCEFLGISWYRGDQGEGFERVPVALLREPGDSSSPNRPLGLQRAGPWEVAMSPEEIRGNSFAKLSHRCHVFWVSTTDFYP